MYPFIQGMMELLFTLNSLKCEHSIDNWWQGDYTPTPEAIKINMKRIQERS